jgi:putative endonuclease
MYSNSHEDRHKAIFFYYVLLYIIYSSSKDRYYVGSCQDVQGRLRKHNTNHSGFTGKTADWIIKWTEEQPDKSTALKRENQIKAWKSRKMIEKLIDEV